MNNWRVVSMSISSTIYGITTVNVTRVFQPHMAGYKKYTYHPTNASKQRVIRVISTPPPMEVVENTILRANMCAPSEDGERVCSKCKTKKPLVAFDRSKLTKDGRRPSCKACDAEYRRTSERYKQTKKNVDQRRSRKKGAARQAVATAISNGSLPPLFTQVCECGRPAKHYHHTNGYEKENQLKVKAVCTECHRAMH